MISGRQGMASPGAARWSGPGSANVGKAWQGSRGSARSWRLGVSVSGMADRVPARSGAAGPGSPGEAGLGGRGGSGPDGARLGVSLPGTACHGSRVVSRPVEAWHGAVSPGWHGSAGRALSRLGSGRRVRARQAGPGIVRLGSSWLGMCWRGFAGSARPGQARPVPARQGISGPGTSSPGAACPGRQL